MSTFVRIAETWKIPKNAMHVFNVKGYELLVINLEGEFYAYENRCPHMGYPLYLGSLDGKILTCGFHYEKFDVTTGKSVGSVTGRPLRSYGVEIEDSSLLVILPNDTRKDNR